VYDNGKKGLKMNGFEVEIVDLETNPNETLWIHDENDPIKAYIISRFFDNPNLPSPFGVIYVNNNKTCFEDLMNQQIKNNVKKDKQAAFNELLKSKNSWMVG
jgi:2-oxoglutarate ferredoxin oxidoreductase subunit beta